MTTNLNKLRPLAALLLAVSTTAGIASAQRLISAAVGRPFGTNPLFNIPGGIIPPKDPLGGRPFGVFNVPGFSANYAMDSSGVWYPRAVNKAAATNLNVTTQILDLTMTPSGLVGMTELYERGQLNQKGVYPAFSALVNGRWITRTGTGMTTQPNPATPAEAPLAAIAFEGQLVLLQPRGVLTTPTN